MKNFGIAIDKLIILCYRIINKIKKEDGYMWIAVIFIAMMYYAVHMAKIIGDKNTYAGRTKGQMAVFIVIQLICLIFAIWVYSWSHDVSLVGAVIIAQIIFIAPITLICLPPHNHDDGGTIDWK